jgi:hypothetical protein
MKRIVNLAILSVLAVAVSASAFAANWNDVEHACGDRANTGTGKHWLEDCIINVFTLQPVHPAINSIAPITGTGIGLGIDRIWRRGRMEYIPSARALVSTDGSTLFRGSFTIAGPGFAHADAIAGTAENDSKASLTFRAQRFDLQHQNFYGVGNFTTQSQLAVYRMQQTSGGITGNLPLAKWASVSVAGDYIQPNILGATSTGRPSIVNAYNELLAPGLAHQPGFGRIQPAAHLLFKPVFAEFIQVDSAYAFYRSTDGPLYSFRQFSGSLAAQHNIRIQTSNTASHRSALSRAICTPLPAKECSLGLISARVFAVTSQTGAGSVVPFYFQPTLGGANMMGEDTLRGFRDYRFRAPAIMGLQTELDHPVWGPIGLLGFYDVGRVGLRASDLDFQHFHHAIGFGMYVMASNIAVFRFSIGFGTGEGIIGNAKAGGGLL